MTRLRLVNNRVVVAALEPRAALAAYDAASGRFELHVGCQGVFGLRRALAEDLLRIEPGRLRVLCDDVGGSFGMKSSPYPEYVGLLHAARALGRPVKWCDERSGSFLSDQQGRATVMEGELALDAEGNFLAVRVRATGDMGAYLTPFGPAMPSVNMQKNLPSLYRTPVIAIETRCAFTNTVPIGPYRGAGRPEANYCMERLIDAAARETGRDPVALRRRNLIPAERHALHRGLRAALRQRRLPGGARGRRCAEADWAGFAAAAAGSAARGRLRGRGLACYLEVTAPPNPEMGGIRFEDDGRVTIVTGTLDYGQGHASAFAQVLVDRLGLPFERIDLVQGDSDQLQAGGGTGGSRSIMASGKALVEASAAVIEKGRALAGHVLEAAPADIEFAAGRFRIAGTDRAIALLDLAARGARGARPAGRTCRRASTSRWSRTARRRPSPTAATSPRSRSTPRPALVVLQRYVAVDDFGTLINPMLAEGQVHGGVAQGIGQALMEQAVYDAAGQLLTGSFMDYAMPRADGVPPIEVGFHPVPATTNPLGVKGCGEAGVHRRAARGHERRARCAAPRAASRHLDMPATPARVWAALRAAQDGAAA